MISLFRDENTRSLRLVKERVKGRAYTFLYLLVIVLFLWIWHSTVTHRFSLKAFTVFIVLCWLSLVYGRLFLKLAYLSFKNRGGLPIQFLCGYLVLNTILFALSLTTPFTITTNAYILIACGLLIALFCQGDRKDIHNRFHYLPYLLCLLLSGVGATLWCTDSLHFTFNDGQNTIFQMWPDCFFHAREINAISQAHGLRNLSDIQMSGAPAATYHYASYAVPAAVLAFTHSSGSEVLASFLLPFGILLTGLAAFSLTASIWGTWPGVAATVAVVLLPDAYQQGFGNKYLSYNFLQQVAPGGLYGVVSATLAWIFILDACKSGKFASIFCGYALTIVTLAYRAHLFVANAFLIMIYPCLFFSRLRASRRLVIAILLTTLFAFIIVLSQYSSAFPTLRLDGSGARQYASILLGSYDPGFLKSFFTWVLVRQQHSSPIFDLYMAGMVVTSTFGLWIVAYPLISFFLKSRTPVTAFFFPLLVLVNYLVMFLGLALDAKKLGTPDELLNRPLVWAYFVIVAWTGAGVYAFLIGNRPPRSLSVGAIAVILMCASLAIPIVFARNIQTLPAWKNFSSYKAINSVPSSLVDACQYIRKHSGVEDIIADSENDPKFVVTALAERQEFAVNASSGEVRSPKGLRDRLDELARFKKMTDKEQLTEFVKTHAFSWYLLRPTSVVAWPEPFLETSVFNSGGYRVFHFTP